MKSGTCVVEVLRGETVESSHRVHIAVVEAGQGLVASAGNPAHHSFVRMRTVQGRLFAKVGAEGFYAAAIPERRMGLALKVEDGSGRAAEPALLAALYLAGVVDQGEFEALSRYALPVILNTRSETVGHIRTRLSF